ncbi:MAG: Methylase involved in ubiquinone/menaquinone biosynthesis [Candidatus Woesebacteria bacterium GW2011_GWA1_37_7]|uniref:Methylase involved in ubiquinone/menaquinone biosynthesis n=1 Tax=Candidatus Woesebacteria bacterium GW2011_GWA1_37_7 TaxID=1618545 RepID=A0A0G0H1N6_9BACT|nr:MAG: Methylase involved in ubiquinone/menaquinone biosynthesis [Candidatus Woesebacteria bacterium GW2011_GWA1_37_7]
MQIEVSAGFKHIPGANKKMRVTYNYLKHTSKSRFRQWTIKNLNSALIEKLKTIKIYSIVDVGCGEGFTLERLRKEKIGKYYLGIDGSNIAVKLGKVLFPKIIFEKHNIYKLPLKDNSYDFVLCTEVLEHLEKPDKALKELVRVSRKYLALSVPNEPFFSLKNLLMIKNIRRFGSSVEHINWWTSRGFVKFVLKEKVKIIRQCHPFPFTLVFLEKL